MQLHPLLRTSNHKISCMWPHLLLLAQTHAKWSPSNINTHIYKAIGPVAIVTYRGGGKGILFTHHCMYSVRSITVFGTTHPLHALPVEVISLAHPRGLGAQ